MMKRIFTVKLILLLALNAFSSPSPQGSQHGQPAAGSMSTPVPGTVGSGMRRGRWREWRRGDPTLLNNLWRSKTPLEIRDEVGTGGILKRKSPPTKLVCPGEKHSRISKGCKKIFFAPCKDLKGKYYLPRYCYAEVTPGNAEVYIVLALLIGFITVVIGCWLSDNCWSPEPEHVVTIA